MISVALLAALVSSTAALRSVQGNSQTAAQAFATVSHDMAVKLAGVDVNRVLIVDFQDSDRQSTPFGAWLADQFGSAPASAWGSMQVVDRNLVGPELDRLHLSVTDELDWNKSNRLAASLSANGVIQGSYGPAENGLGVTLTGYSILKPKNAAKTVVNAKIPLTGEVQSHLQVPLDSLSPKDGIFTPDVGGVSEPVCVYCPNPQFAEEAVRRHVQGSVFLSAVITPEGRASKIAVVKGPGFGLNEQAVNAVKGWKFKPALDVDGKSVSVHTPIQVSFRLYK
jgi:TonB family protein